MRSRGWGILVCALVACSGKHSLDSTGAGGTAGTGGSGTGGSNGDAGPIACSSEGTCAPGSVCVAGGTCAPSKGPCASDDDCEGDTYCCRADCLASAGAPNACIPFGFGPRVGTNVNCQSGGNSNVFSP